MRFLIPDPALTHVRCTVSHLDLNPLGVRLVESPDSPLVIAAAPWARLPDLITGLDGLQIAAYILAGAAYPEGSFLRIYIGETGSLRDRMRAHARDPRKDFTSTVFLITSRDPAFGKLDVEALQFLIDRQAEAADRCRIVRGFAPVPPSLDEQGWARAETWITQARHLLAASGCLLLEPRNPPVLLDPVPVCVNEAASSEAEGAPPSRACRPAACEAALSPDSQSRTYVLNRPGIWAMAVEVDGRVVIRAGSEVSRSAIPSCDSTTVRRRAALQAAEALGSVPGSSERWRLLRDVPISSLTGAARVVTGSHIGAHAWRLLSPFSPAPA